VFRWYVTHHRPFCACIAIVLLHHTDKYAKYPDKSNKKLVHFSRQNTVLGNMAESELTFILWLYATVSIRDGMLGPTNTEEVLWYYDKALRIMRATLKKEMETGQYSDVILNALACIISTAAFSGTFDAAVLHCDATIMVLRLRGNGDVLEGLKSAPPWTGKALQWCVYFLKVSLHYSLVFLGVK
jgi:hypothetical protein